MRSIRMPVSPDGHTAPITHVALDRDGTRLASSSYDGTVMVWDIRRRDSPVRLAVLRHRRLVNSAAWNPAVPGEIATASADKTVAVWQVAADGGAALRQTLARHTDDINSVAWMPDGRRLICVSEDGRATQWDSHTGQFLAEVSSHAAHCMMVAVDPAGRIATVGEDGMVVVSGPDLAREPISRSYDCSIEGCAWAVGTDLLALACDDGSVRLLTGDLHEVRTLAVSGSAARSVAFAEDGELLVVGSYDGSVQFFDSAGERVRRIDDDACWPRSVAVAGGVVAVGSFRNRAHLYDLHGGGRLACATSANHGPNALLGGDTLLVGCDSGSVLAMDLAGGVSAGPLLGLVDGPILALAGTADPLYAATYSGHVVRYAAGRTLISDQLGAPLPSLALTDEGLVAGTYGGELVLLDPHTLAVRERHRAHDGSVKSLAAGSTGFASAATDRTVAIGSLRERAVLWEHGNLVNAVALLGDEVLASASRDHTVKVGRLARTADGWQVTERRTLLGADESAKCVGLLGTPERPVVLCGSYDFGLYAWQVDWFASGDTLTSGVVVVEFDQGVSCITTLNERTAAVASWDGSVAILRLREEGTVVVEHRATVAELAAGSVVTPDEVGGVPVVAS